MSLKAVKQNYRFFLFYLKKNTDIYHQIIVSNCPHNSKRDNGETDPRHSIVDRVLLFAFDLSQELNCLEYVLSLQRNIT